jgi:hypothetical protein
MIYFRRANRSKINPRFFASLRMTLSNGLYCANHETPRSDDRKSEKQDKHACDDQRKHPDQIDVKPGAA